MCIWQLLHVSVHRVLLRFQKRSLLQRNFIHDFPKSLQTWISFTLIKSITAKPTCMLQNHRILGCYMSPCCPYISCLLNQVSTLDTLYRCTLPSLPKKFLFPLSFSWTSPCGDPWGVNPALVATASFPVSGTPWTFAAPFPNTREYEWRDQRFYHVEHHYYLYKHTLLMVYLHLYIIKPGRWQISNTKALARKNRLSLKSTQDML